jgi:hypothetical protein
MQYDELETSFYQVLKEKNLSWFGTLITPGPKDDSSPLLTISKKPYRDLILANTISVFDFRIYLFACQCELLAKMGRISEISRKAGAFLGAFGRRLREVEVNKTCCRSVSTKLTSRRRPSLNFLSSPGYIRPRSALCSNAIPGQLASPSKGPNSPHSMREKVNS